MFKAARFKYYSSLSRAAFLVLIWGLTADQFKLFMDITVRGLILSLLYLAGSIFATIGFFTRTSFVLIFIALAGHALAFNHTPSFISAVFAAAGAVLPTGSFWSVDRALKVRRMAVPYVPTSDEVGRPLPVALDVVFLALIAFILGGPTWNHILHHNNRIFRSWDMYHVIGKNFVNVQFYTKVNGELVPVNYLEAIGYKGVKEVWRAGRGKRELRIVGTERLAELIQEVCKAEPDPSVVRVKARIATLKNGWAPLFNGSEKICKMREETLK